jgi:hypothetical protein
MNRRQLLARGAALVGLSAAGGLVQAVGAEDEPFSWVGDTRDLDTGHVISTSTVKSLDDDSTQFDVYDMLKTKCCFTLAFDEVLIKNPQGNFFYTFEEPVSAVIEPFEGTRAARDWWIRFVHPDHDDFTMVTSMSDFEVEKNGFNRMWDLQWEDAKRFYVGSIEPSLREVKLWVPRKLQFVD